MRATEAAGRDDVRGKEMGRQVPMCSLAIHTVTGVSIVVCNCTGEGLRAKRGRDTAARPGTRSRSAEGSSALAVNVGQLVTNNCSPKLNV